MRKTELLINSILIHLLNTKLIHIINCTLIHIINSIFIHIIKYYYSGAVIFDVEVGLVKFFRGHSG